ncbi:LuxR C-terminal-related transcriptional regulator [Nocardioides iriomotensis]|uniref:Helix-turn-helix transcriptional regulator n=1 Tax=Nocardioides iriomotensis TaxID=715784 RepID=A0A4Q5J8M4_9ACTN|nr:LuxR C-terminal-related transcriptional regulator [Nocardioides iriomotensis]RYU15082.1 helix-turn-helix transcriptional regulator [Nocardioides iriomotensis]
MSSPLLETKLYAARVRRRSVPRPRLADRLAQGLAGRLLLVSAPAGFGKTTALAQWVEGSAGSAEPPAVAWVSLDAGDNDVRTFCRYLVAAVHGAAPDIGARELDLLSTDATASADGVTALLASLLNDVADLANDLAVVLDDYHVIEAPEVHEAVTFVLEHAPPQLHVAIATRVDPPLPVARLRARGDLTEVRAADLRFTPVEADTYFNDVMQLGLTEPQVKALDERTEGWVAALQLAALSLQGRDDVAGFIGTFAGDDRYVVDYLVEEVLQRQPGPTRQFLLRTSVLTRLSGPLCDALTGRDDGRRTLESLERANLFLVPLDDRRQWYRYHHLFADVLRARLLDEQPDQVARLHRRAGDWFESQGRREDAIGHALQSRDPGYAANLVERTVEQSRRERTERTMRGWLARLPAEVVAERPALGVALAGALLSTGTTDGVARALDDAERALSAHDGSTGLRGWIQVYRAGLAQAHHDAAGTLTHARGALDTLPRDDAVGRAAASALLGLASWGAGDLDAAHAAYSASQAIFKEAGFLTDVLGCAVVLANLRTSQGRLQDALDTHVSALDFTAGRSAAPGALVDPLEQQTLRGVVDTYVGMADVHRERNDLAEATRLLLAAEAAGEHAGLPQARYRWHVVMAQVLQAEGDLAGADPLLDVARESYVDDFHPDARPVAATQARLRVAQRRLDEVFAWARARGLALDDEVTYLREYEHLTLVRAHLADPALDRAVRHETLGLLGRLLTAAEAGGRDGTVIDVLVQQAVALDGAGRASAGSLEALERALQLAEPEGYVRTFLDEGSRVLDLLSAAQRAGLRTPYVRDLLARSCHPQEPPQPRVDEGLVVDELSPRERDVLRLLTTELNGPDIARELVLSLNTVRTHTKNIYAKLGVTNRRAAVRRAQELDLLHPSRTT